MKTGRPARPWARPSCSRSTLGYALEKSHSCITGHGKGSIRAAGACMKLVGPWCGGHGHATSTHRAALLKLWMHAVCVCLVHAQREVKRRLEGALGTLAWSAPLRHERESAATTVGTFGRHWVRSHFSERHIIRLPKITVGSPGQQSWKWE